MKIHEQIKNWDYLIEWLSDSEVAAKIENKDFRFSNLRGADLSGANLSEADLSGVEGGKNE
jgi:uncharacterized protein YjbI with pentapeptide repeats